MYTQLMNQANSCMASLQKKVAAQKMAEEQERVRKIQEEMERERRRKDEEERKKQEEEDTRKKYELIFITSKDRTKLIFFRKSEMEARRKVEEVERKRLEEADKLLAVKLQVHFFKLILFYETKFDLFLLG